MRIFTEEDKRKAREAPKEFNPLIKLETKATRGQAIKAMCAYCMGCTKDHIESGWRQEVAACSSRECPLFQFRPYKEKAHG